MDTKKLRQKILDLAIHGKLVPQDPNDEPASVLLARIRAEKEKLIKEGKIKAPKKSKSASDTSHYPKDVPFEVPNGWVWSTIGEVCTVFSAKRIHQSDWQKEGIPFYRAREIVKLSEQGYVDNDLFISEMLYDDYISSGPIPTPGDVMISAVGTIGKTYIVRATDRFYFKDASVLCLKNPYLFPAYLDLYLQSTLARTQMRYGSKGTTVDTITIEKASDYLIPIPPSAEQKRVVSYLETILTIIASIESQKTCIDNLINKSKNRILNLAIHGKLVPQNPTDEPAINLLRRIYPNFKPTDNLHYEGELPNGWCFSTIGELFQHNTGKALNGRDHIGEELRYITTSNLYWDRFDLTEVRTMAFTEAEKEKCRATKGDLLVCEGGDIGRSAIWPYDYDVMIQNHIHRLRPKGNISVRFYYYIFLLYKQMGLIGGKGIAILGLSSRELDKMVVPVPPVPEQHRIVTVIENLFAQMDALASNLS